MSSGSERAEVQLDHVFCMVDPDADWAARLTAAGWRLDAGSTHAGQGTRNRRLRWADCYLELLWVHDAAEARHNALRLDRRAAGARARSASACAGGCPRPSASTTGATTACR